jgi:hypothetical protein
MPLKASVGSKWIGILLAGKSQTALHAKFGAFRILTA